MPQEQFGHNMDLKVASLNDIILVTCPQCGEHTPETARLILRGAEFDGKNCSTHFSTQPGSSTPISVTPARCQICDQYIDIKIVIVHDSLWFVVDNNEINLLSTLEYDSDRAVAIIISSMIEVRIERAVLSRLINVEEPKLQRGILEIGGPLAIFKYKNDIARLMGIIIKEAHSDLDYMRKIRNTFAHDLSVKDFRSTTIHDLAGNFKLLRSLVEDVDVLGGKEIGLRVNLNQGEVPAIYVRDYENKKKRARDRYLLTAQILSVRLAAAGLRVQALPLV